MSSPAVHQKIPAGFICKTECISLLDQTRLPTEERYLEITNIEEAYAAILRLSVRGAPAIAIFAAHALAQEARQLSRSGLGSVEARSRLLAACQRLDSSRPTAVNLGHAMRRMELLIKGSGGDEATETLAARLTAEAGAIEAEDQKQCQLTANFAASLIEPGSKVMTICHTGAIATAGVGTALGGMHVAHQQGKAPRVFACETRPLLQGARLTAWELSRSGVPVTLLTDSMAAHVMQDEGIDLVMVGADRIVANGDSANKIGTFGLAVLAKHFGIPFYVVAPSTTLDPTIRNGKLIVIEERAGTEVRGFRSEQTAPPDVPVRNPAFDVTPAELIEAIITDTGIHRPPYSF